MQDREELDFWACDHEILTRLRNEGVLCTVVDADDNKNMLTLGWGLIGRSYGEHPMVVISIASQRHSWGFLESVPEFVIAVPDDNLREATTTCGFFSGRMMDKFKETGLTPVDSVHVRAPSVLECPINVECRVYTQIAPPHALMSPEFQERPLEEQRTVYFAEVLGTYGWVKE